MQRQDSRAAKPESIRDRVSHSETVSVLRADPSCRAVRDASRSQVWLLPTGSVPQVERTLGTRAADREGQ
jgi:hypothetical protein